MQLDELKLAIRNRDYYILGRYSFFAVVAYSVLASLSGSSGFVDLIPPQVLYVGGLNDTGLFIIPTILRIGFFGIIPVVLFIKDGLNKYKGGPPLKVITRIPLYVGLPYGLCLFIFLLLIVFSRF